MNTDKKTWWIIMQPGKQLAGTEYDTKLRCHKFLLTSDNKYMTRFYELNGNQFYDVAGIPITIFEN